MYVEARLVKWSALNPNCFSEYQTAPKHFSRRRRSPSVQALWCLVGLASPPGSLVFCWPCISSRLAGVLLALHLLQVLWCFVGLASPLGSLVSCWPCISSRLSGVLLALHLLQARWCLVGLASPPGYLVSCWPCISFRFSGVLLALHLLQALWCLVRLASPPGSEFLVECNGTALAPLCMF